jgi:uncharacterized protein YbbK (DUF523 family)
VKHGNILISSCLLGNPVRYNGTGFLMDHQLIQQWQKENRLIAICPEVAGGMSVPRAPAEISNGDGATILLRRSTVINENQQDVTEEFILGAKQALSLALENNCVVAILTEHSPSCGSTTIYDGSFSDSKKEGQGVTSALLEQQHIRIFNQHQIDLVDNYLESFDRFKHINTPTL